jgi:hypothetical protein
VSKKRKKKASSGVKNMASDSWEKLEQLFAARVAMVLNAMQIPTHDDVQELADRVAQLTREVEKLTGQPVARPARKKTSASRKRPKSKSTPARKPRARKKT